MNKIALHDLPEILALVNKKIKFDIVGNLPIEVVALVFGYLDLEDVLRLQIVSRRWKTVLSSDVVQCAPIHAPTRWLQERYALDPANFLKKRLRIQNGIFLTRVLLSPLLQVENLWATSADYSEGHFAWIDWSSRVLNMLNLWTGELVKFTTEERQEFKETRVSNVLAVAISRQYGIRSSLIWLSSRIMFLLTLKCTLGLVMFGIFICTSMHVSNCPTHYARVVSLFTELR